MKYAVTGKQMKEIDQDTIGRIGIPSLVLMERAALAVADAAERAIGEQPGRSSDGKRASVLIACGTGNNGADGIAAARILKGRRYDVLVLLAGNQEHATPEHQLQRQIAGRLDVPMVSEEWFQTEEHSGRRWDVVIDALFGIGLARPVEGSYAKLIHKLNQMEKGALIAVDIPSGIHGQTGAVMGNAVQADATVTFGYQKTGMLLYPGKTYAGSVQVADIGFSDVSVERTGWDGLYLEKEDLQNLPQRRPDGNKGTFGKLLLIAGSQGMCGAAYLCALAAYRSGIGLVKILTVEENRTVLQTLMPEAIVTVYDPRKLTGMGEDSLQKSQLESHCDWADAIVMGPGLGQEAWVDKLVETVLAHVYVPMVLDADGLNAVARNPGLIRYFTENIVVTPHMGEMSRLTGKTIQELKGASLEEARDYAAGTGAACVLKDAVTVIADKEGTAYINTSGCSAMAKAGSGDVLAGIIGTLLAQGMEVAEAAAYGVYVHGLAGEQAAEKLHERSVLAHEIADCLPEVFMGE